MGTAETVATLLFVVAVGIAVLTFVLGANPWFWFGTWLGNEGDPEGMKEGCGALVKWGIGLPAVLVVVAMVIVQCTDATV